MTGKELLKNVTLLFDSFAGHIFVNWSKVTYPDASVTNGVMHVVNRVLIPKLGLTECEDDESFDKDDDNSDAFKAFFGKN